MKYTVHADKRTSAAYLVYDGDGNFLHDYADDSLAEFIQKAMNNYEALQDQNAVLREALELFFCPLGLSNKRSNFWYIWKDRNPDDPFAEWFTELERRLEVVQQALSLTPSEAAKRIMPEGTIAARFIIGCGEEQKIVYWDKDNPDDTGVTPIEAARAAGVEV